MKLLLINQYSMTVQEVDGFEEANRITAATDVLDVELIKWAIEEYGRCDGNEWTIIPKEWQEKE